ncbi:hypothetical protein F4776DRAFT_659948 [Hypoxylon sp. NC0597]|nr:hypothetical protein F4776DRAFT_659948 [Hypoxylon sp. NC0597]
MARSGIESFQMMPDMVTVFALISVVCFTALVAVGLRLYSRYTTEAGFGWNDGFALMSMVFGTSLLYIEGLLYTSGVGYPIAEVGSNKDLLIELITVHTVMFVLAIVTNKISMLCFYFRVFTTNLKTRMATAVFIGIFLMWGLASIVDVLAVWYRLEKNDTGEEFCGLEGILKRSSILSIAGDLVVLLLPLPAIWNLHTYLPHTRIRIGLFLALGVTVTIVAMLAYVAIASQDFQDPEFAILSQNFIAYAAFEANMGIVYASLPITHNLFTVRMPKLSDREDRMTTAPQGHSYLDNSGRNDRLVPLYHWDTASPNTNGLYPVGLIMAEARVDRVA